MTRKLAIALMIALGLHVFFMSAVVIVTPAQEARIKPFAPINSLGPLLKKTAFDIMMEVSAPAVVTAYGQVPAVEETAYLLRPIPVKRRVVKEDMTRYYATGSVDDSVFDFLSGGKSIPAFLLASSSPVYGHAARNIIYKPSAPVIVRGLYGDRGTYYIKVRALVSSNGIVKSVENVTTSGYPQLDLIAAKYVRSWIFEERYRAGDYDRWEEVEVMLKTGEEKDDKS